MKNRMKFVALLLGVGLVTALPATSLDSVDPLIGTEEIAGLGANYGGLQPMADVHSVVSKSIAFVKPEAGDFTPRNRDIPKKLGIHPLNLKGAGLYVSAFRKTIGKEPDGCANHPEWLKRDPNHVNPRQSQRKNGQKGKRNNENDQRK